MANRLSLFYTLIFPRHGNTSPSVMVSISVHTQHRDHMHLENHHLPKEVVGSQQNLDWQQDLADISSWRGGDIKTDVC